MTAKTIKIEAPEQLLLPVSELPHGRMFIDPENDQMEKKCGSYIPTDGEKYHRTAGDKLSMVVTDMAGAYHIVDLNTGNLVDMNTQSLINVHPVDKFTATITLR